MFTSSLEVLAQVQTATQAEWFASQDVIPASTVCREIDTGNYKVGDGIRPYPQLPYSYLTIDFPVGSVILYASNVAPDGWALCDGSLLDRTSYSQLFALIGTTYGSGDGSTTFNVPNLTQRFLSSVADDGGSGLPFMNFIIRISSSAVASS